MAKLKEGIQFTGTINNLCFYVVNDRTIVRTKSNLSRKRVLKDKAFAPTRKYAGNFAIACRIGSMIYKALPGEIKGRWIYRSITGEAASLLYEGSDEQKVKDMLWKKYINEAGATNKEVKKEKTSASKQKLRQLRTSFLEHWEKQGKPVHLFRQGWGRNASVPSVPDLERSAYGYPIWMR
jgi:hypothetical protein